MIIDLVGYTGFVGSNLNIANCFTHLYNTQNINESYGTNPDILVYAGVTGTKYIANSNPGKDAAIIKSAIDNIIKIKATKLVLISTIDVYERPEGLTEDNEATSQESFVYGYHRSELENWVRNNVSDYHIIRLPGIYGKNLKKNFIYDLSNPIPNVLNAQKYSFFAEKSEIIKQSYAIGPDGFYHINGSTDIKGEALYSEFKRMCFTALNFTDSRGVFQYYNLKFLWNHICKAIENNIKILNIATEPFSISELYEFIYEKPFVNEICDNPPYYNFKTKYAELYGGNNGYIFSKEEVMNDIKEFIGEKR